MTTNNASKKPEATTKAPQPTAKKKLAGKASKFPVEFVYPTVTTIVPANVGIIANAKNQKAAEAFVEYLLSDEGQQILLDPKIQRLPVKPAAYDKAPAGYPNPLKDSKLGSGVNFNADLSEGRYELLNSLYDRLITFRLKELNAAWKAIQDTEKKLGANASAEARKLLGEARKLATSVPITEKEASDPAISGSFQELKPGQKAAGRQAEFEEKWDSFAKKNYAEAKALAEKAAKRGEQVDEAALKEFTQPIADQFDKDSHPFACSARLFDDGIIDPRDTRRVLGMTLSICMDAERRGVRTNSFGVARF